jgi:hypothetical protein
MFELEALYFNSDAPLLIVFDYYSQFINILGVINTTRYSCFIQRFDFK